MIIDKSTVLLFFEFYGGSEVTSMLMIDVEVVMY